MYWSMAFGLGGLSLSWLLGLEADSDDELALELVAPPRPLAPALDPRIDATSCWMLAAEEPSAGEVQRWRLSKCADRKDASSSSPSSMNGVLYDGLDLERLSY
jgi:hypothetical protein